MPKIKNRHFTPELIIEDYLLTKDKLGKNRLGREEYISNGQYTRNNIEKAFGSWNGMKKEIGERPLTHKKVSREDVEKEAYALFQKHGKLTAEIMRNNSYTQPVIDRIFGNFGNMLKELGIPQEAIGKTKQLTDEEFLLPLLDIQEKYGYVNTTLLEKHSLVPNNSFINRYGTFGEACLKAGVYHVGEHSLWTDEGEAMNTFHKIAELINEPKFHTELTFNWLRNDKTLKPMPVDCYFPKNNLVVEYHGPRHYKEDFWLSKKELERNDQYSNPLIETQRRDALKKLLVSEQNIRMIEIYDYEKHKVVEIIKNLTTK